MNRTLPSGLSISTEVADALHEHRPVVAPKSIPLSHGLPAARNPGVAAQAAVELCAL